MSDLRQPFALLASIRRGLDAVQWLDDHNLPVPAEHVELVALMAAELAEVLAELVPEGVLTPGLDRRIPPVALKKAGPPSARTPDGP